MADLDEVVRHIPRARRLTLPGGIAATVATHGPDETAVLRNLGWDIDAPTIHARKVWCGPFQPYIHQKAIASFMVMNPRGYVLAGLGVGKSASSVWAIRYLRAARQAGITSGVRATLVVAPLSTIRDVWEKEIKLLDMGARIKLLHGPKAERLAMLEEEADWYIVNHDGVKILKDALQKHPLIDAVIIDESTAFKNGRTQRWRAMNAIVNQGPHFRRCWALTGTPMSQSPTDVWGQCRIVTPDTVPRSFVVFRDSVMLKQSEYQWVPKQGFMDVVYRALSPAVRVDKEDCIDLPPISYIYRHADLTKDQEKLVKALKKEWLAVMDSGRTITPANAGVRAQKLLQIWQGVVLDDDGQPTLVDAGPRYDLMLELIEAAANCVIVFVPFRGVISEVEKRIRDAGIECVVVHGGVGEKERQKRFDRFRSRKAKVLVAHPRTTSHGLSFTNADTTIWFGPTPSAETYIQANQRMARPGQKNKMSIYHLYGSPREKELYELLDKRVSLQDKALELIKKEIGNG